MSNLKNILKKITDLNLKDKRSEALLLVNRSLKKHPYSKKLKLKKAFLLYHIAIEPKKYNLNNDQENKMINESIDIYKKSINNKNKKDNLSSRMYLAQIYAILGNKDAVKIGLVNYKENSNTLTANRLMDIYYRLGDLENAKKYLEIFIGKAREEKVSDIMLNVEASLRYKQFGMLKESKKYSKKISESKVENEQDKNILKFYKNA